jgi:hypothetical protein
MDKTLLINASRQLNDSDMSDGNGARPQAIRQFNALLLNAKELHPSRPDIESLEPFDDTHFVNGSELRDSARRLLSALDLRRPGTVTEIATSIKLPPDAPLGMETDLVEFQEAVALGMRRTALLLSGAIAEALLLLRHPDNSERGPGLAKLLSFAKDQRLFGRDTLRQLESLNDYRDLIHTRSGPRNRIELNDARVEHAAIALKLLCSELKEEDVRYSS